MKPTAKERRKIDKASRAFKRGMRGWHDRTRCPYKEFSIESLYWLKGYQASGTIEEYKNARRVEDE